jgi:hypothetical protein
MPLKSKNSLLLAAVIILAGSLVSYGTVAKTGRTPQTRVYAPYLQALLQDGLTIMWRTAAPEASEVSVGAEKARDTFWKVWRSSTAVTAHEITVSGLRPGTRYRYSVAAPDGGVRGRGSFKTAPGPAGSKFKFVVWGDSQAAPEVFSGVASAMLAGAPDFAVGVGDYTDNGCEPERYATEFFGPAEKFLASVPVFLAPGNHDYGYNHRGFWNYSPSSPGAREFRELFRNPAGDSTYYSFDYGNSHFIVLDPNEGAKHDTFDVSPGSGQYDWFVKDLDSPAARAARHVFVFFHEPPFTTTWDEKKKYDGEELLRRHIVPLLENRRVTAVFSGHAHVYERGELNGVAYIVTGGGGGILDQVQYKKWEQVRVVLHEHHFMRVTVDGELILVEAVAPNGKVLDSFTLVSHRRSDRGKIK